MKWLSCLLVVIVIGGTTSVRSAEPKRAMTVEDLFRFKRVSDPQISPDGKAVAYVVGVVDLEKNSNNTDIWLAATDGSWKKQLTNSPKQDRHPRFSPDGKKLLFESNRSGDNQLWVLSLDGGEAQQLTTIATEAGNSQWSPDGKTIAFVSAVYPEFSGKPFAESNALNKKKMEEIAKNPVKAKVFKGLFFRHWDSYVEDKRQHLFVVPAPAEPGVSTSGGPRDVTHVNHFFQRRRLHVQPGQPISGLHRAAGEG
jgi:dipeptidyl aminopeptidase/acylaminoacyl peptidase